jgi:hypothetical protein
MGITVKTIKKKPLTVNMHESGATPAPAAPAGEGATPSPEAADQKAAPATPAAVHAPNVAVKRPSYIAAGICAILEVIMLITIVVLQYLEGIYYKNPRDVFPTMGAFSGTPPSTPGMPVGMTPSPAPEPTPAPAAEPAASTNETK